jgi:hypothetical protein
MAPSFRRRGIAKNTGPAIATDGGIAVSGVVENLIVQTAPTVRSTYREQVRLIAPNELTGRDDEIGLLRDFCASDDSSYLWIRAKAWSGKTALTSSFCLNPPERTKVVSFFVTRRYAQQNDRRAFAEIVILQLAEILNEPERDYLTQATVTSQAPG